MMNHTFVPVTELTSGMFISPELTHDDFNWKIMQPIVIMAPPQSPTKRIVMVKCINIQTNTPKTFKIPAYRSVKVVSLIPDQEDNKPSQQKHQTAIHARIV